MTGYEEALTDPSYAGQILTFTYPLIGNYGISGSRRSVRARLRSGRRNQADRASSVASLEHARSCRRLARRATHSDARRSRYARDHDRAARTRDDSGGTRRRDGALERAERELADYVRTATTKELVPSVAARHRHVEGTPGGRRVTLIDCGVKRAILRELTALGDRSDRRSVQRHAKRSCSKATRTRSSFRRGPATRRICRKRSTRFANLVGRKPLFGVCLGHQLLALACGAQTYKLPYGHRGGNQPVKDHAHDEVLITAHNHGYAVDANTMPGDLEATMTNLNDGTNEGFRHRSLPIAAVQFHPEASPGPFDARRLFAEWLSNLSS